MTDEYAPKDWFKEHVAGDPPIKWPNERGRSYDGGMLDITGAEHVEIQTSRLISGFVIHVNVDGLCVLRMCRITGSVKYEDLT